MSVVPRNQLDALHPQPAQKLPRVVERRRHRASLDEAVLHRQPAPRVEYVLSNAIRAVAPLPNRNASIEPARYMGLGPYHDVAFNWVRFSDVGIFVPSFRR